MSAMLMFAERLPEVVGLNSALMVQLAPAVSDAPQVVELLMKSPLFVPVMVMELMVRVAVPVFFMVTDLAALVTPIACVPKLRLVGVRVTAAPPLELKVAVTALAALIVTEQVPVPEHAPLHPAKVDPVDAVAVRVTLAPLVKLALQMLGQVMPEGLLVTEPDPVPASVTVKVKVLARFSAHALRP